MNQPQPNPRQLALEICTQLLQHGLSLNDLLDQQLKLLPAERDKGFCSELCYGFCRYYYVLQAELGKRVKKPLKARDLDVQVIILLGLYQIRFMRVEDYAAVNESVKLLKNRQKVWAKGLVNAILRSYIRDLTADATIDKSVLSELEQEQAYPAWMRQKIRQDWSEHAATVYAAGNQHAPMVLRVDCCSIPRTQYLLQLKEQGIQATEHPLVDSALILQSPVAVDQLTGFDAGLVSVQDASAQLAAGLLNCEKGMRVLDACAAPGGKTLHLLQQTPGLQLIALDKDPTRLLRVEENLQRAGLQAELICADAAKPEEWFEGLLFDRILLDAPCSASGIMRRHPDIRLLRKPSDIAGLAEQQKRLLKAMWGLLKPGGQLLYSTCSLFKEENERQIQAFIGSHDKCIELPLNNVQWGLQRPVGRQILPGIAEMDGFYYAVLEKSV